MLRKNYRLSERDVKKVLRGQKPFFSHRLSLHVRPNRERHGRFGIVIGGKNVPSAVCRNFFRRRFYDMVRSISERPVGDMLFVVKRGIVLSMRDADMVRGFHEDITFLLRKAQILP